MYPADWNSHVSDCRCEKQLLLTKYLSTELLKEAKELITEGVERGRPLVRRSLTPDRPAKSFSPTKPM